MIADQIQTDHAVGREIFAVTGNAAHDADVERAKEFNRLSAVWRAHGAVLEEVILPELAQLPAHRNLVADLRACQQEVAQRIDDLARRAPSEGPDQHWLADFERLKAASEQQCTIEATRLIRAILEDLPPERIAHLSREGRRVRDAHQ